MVIKKLFGSIILLSLIFTIGCAKRDRDVEMHDVMESIDKFYVDDGLYVRYTDSEHKLEVVDDNVYKEYRVEGTIALLPIEEQLYQQLGCSFGNLIFNYDNDKVISVIDKDNTLEAEIYEQSVLPCPQWSDFRANLQTLTDAFGKSDYDYSVDINGKPFIFTESSIYYMTDNNMVGSIDRTIDIERLDYFDYIRNATENKIRFNTYVRNFYNTDVDFAYFTPNNRLYILKDGELTECG